MMNAITEEIPEGHSKWYLKKDPNRIAIVHSGPGALRVWYRIPGEPGEHWCRREQWKQEWAEVEDAESIDSLFEKEITSWSEPVLTALTNGVSQIANSITIDQAIKQSSALQAQIDALYELQDKLLAPAVQEVIKRDDPNEIMGIVRRLPTGFYKSELRTIHIKRMEDFEYRQRYTQEAT